MGMKQYADHRGIDLTSVRQMIDEGKLEGALKIYSNGNRKKYKIFWEKADRILKGYEDPEPVEHTTATTSGGNSSLTKARTAKVALEAQTAKLKFEQLSGSLVNRNEVVNVAKQMGRMTKEALLTLPDRLAPILASETEIEEINLILTREIDTALRNLALGNYDFFKKEEIDD